MRGIIVQILMSRYDLKISCITLSVTDSRGLGDSVNERSYSFVGTHYARRICDFALEVLTKLSQSLEGLFFSLTVRISTTWPFSIRESSGTIFRSTFAPTARCPISLWMA
jgi:hypothetical protein